MNERILVVDGDPPEIDSIQLCLEHHGYEAYLCSDPLKAVDLIERDRIQLIVLDTPLPFIDVLRLTRLLRSTVQASSLPILLLTARGELDDRVSGLEAGADDYLVKPIAGAELLARIRALLRRASRGKRVSPLLVRGGVALDREAREVSRDGRPVALTTREFNLLALLMENAGGVVSRDKIMESLWSTPDAAFAPNVIDAHVYSLRKKLGLPSLLHAARGVGFVFHA